MYAVFRSKVSWWKKEVHRCRAFVRLRIWNVVNDRWKGLVNMILVIFEVTLKEDCMERYLELVAGLKEDLLRAKGYISSKRFNSFASERTLMSISVWEDEESVDEWRNQQRHRMSQQKGRESLFEEYSITVASEIRTYTDKDRREAPVDSNHYFM